MDNAMDGIFWLATATFMCALVMGCFKSFVDRYGNRCRRWVIIFGIVGLMIEWVRLCLHVVFGAELLLSESLFYILFLTSALMGARNRFVSSGQAN